MAEALGLAASVIAVVDMAGKVGGASLKLARLWDEVKEVPAMLFEKAERIRDLEEFLDDTENQTTNSLLPEAVCNRGRLQKHLAKARGALADLQEMFDQMQTKITSEKRGYKRRFALTKVVFKKSEWKALENKLDSALYLFSIAQTQYLMATSTFCTTFMLQGLPASTEFSDKTPVENSCSLKTDDNDDYSSRKKTSKSIRSTVPDVFNMPYSASVLPTFRFGFGGKDSFQFSVQTPAWLTGSVYSILAQRSFQGWQLNLRAYEVVREFDDELLDLIASDDALGVFQYLEERKITRIARNHYGDNLVSYAVIWGAITVTNILLEQGLELFDVDIMLPSSSKNLINHSSMMMLDHGPHFLELIAEHGLDDVLVSIENAAFVLAYGINYQSFQRLLKRYGFRYELSKVETRLQHLRKLAESCYCWCPENLSLILPEIDHLDAGTIELSMEVGGHAILHSLALGWAWRLAALGVDQTREQTLKEKEHWSRLIRTCLRKSRLSLHHLDSVWSWDGGYTEASPFSAIMWSLTHGTTQSPIDSVMQHVRRVESVFAVWIEILFSSDINLLEYGRRERQLYEQGFMSFHQRQDIWFDPTKEGFRPSLIGITYGPRPEHWHLWWTLGYEDYAGEFWDLVESQYFKMPGSWVDGPWDPIGFSAEEWKRLKEWKVGETASLIWSEYRKVRPPI